MAADLAGTPTTGLRVQLCGDAHLANFGSYAAPDRTQVFDVNDFDETLPGPWEWDVKRLAASVVVAGRDRGFAEDECGDAAVKALAGYRLAMARFAAATTLDTWYWQLPVERIRQSLPTKTDRHRLAVAEEKARSKDSLQALAKLAEKVDGQYRIRSAPPLLIPLRDLSASHDPDRLRRQVRDSLVDYTESLSADRRHLLRRFDLVDVALKVVGVGSVGTRCYVALFMGKDASDPLFLQVKEATTSVLENYLAASAYGSHGRRVVEGQHLMQAAGDIFLGWSQTESGEHYYWRQLHDMKGSADVASMDRGRMSGYASLCGATLAHAHARSGDALAISGYLGSGDAFDRALVDFAVRYADQNERDYEAFVGAIDSGRIQAEAD